MGSGDWMTMMVIDHLGFASGVGIGIGHRAVSIGQWGATTFRLCRSDEKTQLRGGLQIY